MRALRVHEELKTVEPVPVEPPIRTRRRSTEKKTGARTIAPFVAAAILFVLPTSARAEYISLIGSNFNGTAVPNGDTVWFSSVFKLTGPAPTGPAVVRVQGGTVQFSAGPTTYNLAMPNAQVILDPTRTQATTSFDAATNTWITVAPISFSGNLFLDGYAFTVPSGGLPGGINPVTMTLDFSSTVPLSLNWQWSAAAYTSFGSNYNSLNVKPSDSPTLLDPNSDHAGTPEAFAQYVTGGARGGGGANATGSYSATESVILTNSSLPPPNAVPTPSGILLGLVGIGACLLVHGCRRVARASAQLRHGT